MSVDTLDGLCQYRECYQVGTDHGTFNQGVGYTSYHEHARTVCMERHLRGCPSEIPAPISERARCCHAPRVRPAKGKLPRKQRCLTCSSSLQGYALQCAREGALPSLYPCKHLAVREDVLVDWVRWFRCEGCLGYFRGKPGFWQQPVPDEDYWVAFEAACGK